MKRLGLLILALIFNAHALAQEATLPSLNPILEKIMPAVVHISAQREAISTRTPFSKDSSKQDQQQKSSPLSSVGSGVIVDAKQGFIMTNAHLLLDVKTVTVSLSDGRHYKAKIIGADPATDMAIVQIKADDLTALPLGNSDQLKIGDYVMAIGNPFGLSQTVTSGIVSALERTHIHPDGYESFIQTDAAINPGNSGGALINLNGELIGINTAILSSSGGGNIGIGFAIPVNMAKNIADQLVQYGSVRRGLLGVLVQTLTPDLANAFEIKGEEGVLVTQVREDSPADTAGLKVSDVLKKINNVKVTDSSQVRNIVGLLRVGDHLSIDILRDGKKMNLKTVIVDPQQHKEQLQKQNPFLFGIVLEDFEEVTPAHGRIKGVGVFEMMENSAAWHAGLRPGDVIVWANKKPINNIDDLEAIAKESKDKMLVNVVRSSGSLFFVIKA